MNVRIGDKLIELDNNGIAKATSITRKNKDGGTDVEIHIPCLKILQKQPNKEVSDGVRDL